MHLPSDWATHWPISGQSALIPPSSKELFFPSLFWKSASSAESTRWAEKKDLSPVACHGMLQHWRSSPKITTATCYTLLLPVTLLPPTTPERNFLTLTVAMCKYVCYVYICVWLCIRWTCLLNGSECCLKYLCTCVCHQDRSHAYVYVCVYVCMRTKK